MFRSLSDSDVDLVKIQINGHRISVPAHRSVWSAMALVGETITRLAPVTGAPRSAYCAMGVCFECLVQIDGLPNQQACQIEVYEGMCVEQQTITDSSQAVAEPESRRESLTKKNQTNAFLNPTTEVSSHE